ncbi:hypothetical protein RCT91_06895, partial [Escherichia coli]|nr:hypothetical protein [Escherichia coli]
MLSKSWFVFVFYVNYLNALERGNLAQIKGLVISQGLTGIISMCFLMCISNGVCILPVNRSITTLYSGGGDM